MQKSGHQDILLYESVIWDQDWLPKDLHRPRWLKHDLFYLPVGVLGTQLLQILLLIHLKYERSPLRHGM